MRRSISSLVIAAAIVLGALGALGASVGGTGVAHALDVAAGSASATPAAVTETTVPDTTVAPAAEEEDRTAGYIVMVVAVLVFVGGFAILAVRSRKR